MNSEKTKEILRKVEHCALRDFYYHDPAHFSEVMLSVPNVVFNIINSRCQEAEQSNPYLPDQFVASIIESPDGVRALKITFPEIKESTFCRSVYAFLSEDNKKPGYYCIEFSSKGMKENPFISEWFPYGKSYTYMIYNSEGLTQENEFLKCVELYRDTDPVSVIKHCEAELQKKEKADRVEELS